jgi:hypothetical protein
LVFAQFMHDGVDYVFDPASVHPGLFDRPPLEHDREERTFEPMSELCRWPVVIQLHHLRFAVFGESSRCAATFAISIRASNVVVAQVFALRRILLNSMTPDVRPSPGSGANVPAA